MRSNGNAVGVEPPRNRRPDQSRSPSCRQKQDTAP